MENKNEKVLPENQNTTENAGEKSKAIAEEDRQTTEDNLKETEEKQETINMNACAKSRSAGSQSSESSFDLDPAGAEFLKGIRGK